MQRRQLVFKGLEEAVTECQALLDSGYQRGGNWTLAQACRHLRLTQDASINGYPPWMSLFAPVRPLIRWLLLPRLLRGDSPAGIRTAAIFLPPEDMQDQVELNEFTKSVERFQQHTGYLYPHPGFGKLERSQLEEIHAAHAAHHLGFLLPVPVR